jgi:molybdopterin-containing oxidoreductase family iron-sulfur binding subunit
MSSMTDHAHPALPTSTAPQGNRARPGIPAYWRGLEALEDSPEYRAAVEKEFPGALEPITDPVSRRKFLGLMGAAMAMGGLVGCRRPLATILPYSKLPEDVLPGVPLSYATVFPFRGVGEGILVTSHEGRPTKVEGNPDHPGSLGATHVFAQATILELYDPDRSQTPVSGGEARTWDDFTAWSGPHFAALRRGGGAGLAFLCEPTASPAVRALRDRVAAAYPQALWCAWEPVNRDAAIEGSAIAFGRPLRTQLRLDQADVILSLDADFLFAEPNAVRHARDFARGRRVTTERDAMNRLYAAECDFSITGASADHRLRTSHGQVAVLAQTLAEALAQEGVDLPAGLGRGRGASPAPDAARWIRVVARDLAAHRGRAVVLAGSSQPAAVHALVHVLNRALGAVGTVVRCTEEPYPGNQARSVTDFARALDGGRVNTVVVLGGNPAYDAPADLDLATKLHGVEHVVRLGRYEDETSERAAWHLPLTHSLESWGDAEAWDGTRSIQQPLIAPLYAGKSELELLSMLVDGAEPDAHALVRELYRTTWGTLALDTRWNRALNDGLIPDTAYPEVPAAPDAEAAARAWNGMSPAGAPTAEAMEIVFRPDGSVWDGRFANNGWLQELPDAMTKMVWDNAAMVSPATARALGVKTDDLVTVTASGMSLTLPVWVAPGLPDFSIQLPLGYGRRRAGRVGNGVGFNTYALRSTGALHAAAGVTVAKAGGTYRLVSTQVHNVMEGRPLVREASLETYREEPEFAAEMAEVPPLVTLYTDREYGYDTGHQWGMSIDLGTCIGCNACAIACQSENNVATVGKDQVHRGREMHWIRIDRYYTGEPEEAEAVQQPLPCMQCENAPCETVCPVGATTHSDEGLNQMVYNRCIGTRYCNNNCPYKVRRFNYYNWRKDMTEVEKGAMNPDVTVRMRGIMEKCTYCVQRINRTRIRSKVEGREIRDGEIVTACQQVCPTESIVFGDIRDPESRVSRLKAQNRDYTILAEINTRPRTSFLARIRNRNPELGAAPAGGSDTPEHHG